MGKALYRKYRSKSLSEIVGQEHITQSLDAAIKSDKISHAYLFTGPRGTGKTSIARILAHEINKLPYTDDSVHMDIIEIDAASNRRIDEIRELRERVHTAPTSAKYKVYIIDEVHMLTKEAFNALLKTLEEPPAHVVFILATTEAHKLPETIISRTQRYAFKPIPHQKVVDHLRTIATQESIAITDEALAVIAVNGGGSFRDSISLLDQVSSGGAEITVDDVRHSLGIAPDEVIQGLLQALDSHSIAGTLDALSNLRQAGYQSGQIAKQLIQHLRERLLAGDYSSDSVALIAALLDIPQAHDLDAKLEVILVGYSLLSQQQQREGSTGTSAVLRTASLAVTEPKKTPQPEKFLKNTDDAMPIETPKPQENIPPATHTGINATSVKPDALWATALDQIKKRHNTVYGIARMATATVDGANVILAFEFPFHQKRLNEARNKQILVDILSEISGTTIHLSCVMQKSSKSIMNDIEQADTALSSKKSSTLQTISDIFGDAEVLDS